MTDLQRAILAAIDTLRGNLKPCDADAIRVEVCRVIQLGFACRRVPAELRDMRKAGIVVYDRSGSGWRRA